MEGHIILFLIEDLVDTESCPVNAKPVEPLIGISIGLTKPGHWGESRVDVTP